MMVSLVIHQFSQKFWQNHTVTSMMRFRMKDDDWRCRLQWEQNVPVVFPDVGEQRGREWVRFLTEEMGCRVELLFDDNTRPSSKE